MSDYILQTRGLGISFGGLHAVQGVDLAIREGEIYGLIGPNGAGKTTLFNMLTGVYRPTAGQFFLDGKDMTGRSQEAICRGGIARTFQNIRLFGNMTVVRNVMVGLHHQPSFRVTLTESLLRLPRHHRVERDMRERAKELLEVFGLSEERNQLACNLPYGKQRKLEMARALATSPRVLLLDEPAAGMNPQETAGLVGTIRTVRDRFRVTILLIEHDMALVGDVCDRLTVLNFGQTLAQGETGDVLRDPAVVRAYLGD